MPPASAPSLCTIPVASAGLDPEFLRVLRISDPGAALDGPLTFAPPQGGTVEAWLGAWRTWRDEPFAASIGPAMVLAAEYAGQGKAREIQGLNASLHTALEPLAAVRSALAGSRLLRRLSTSRGERWLGKLQAGAAAGGQPIHFALVHAAQGALFHLPLRQLVPGYAYWEWTAALAACPPAAGNRPAFLGEAASLSETAATILSARASHADHAQAVFSGS